MTKQQQEQASERDDTETISLAIYKDMEQQLQTAWKEVDDERAKITKLDIEVAKLKDENAKLEKIKENLLQTFQDLYQNYQTLYDQVINSNTAITITAGKLAESLVKCKFTIPQQEQPQS